jgi:plasmid maintenance system killer protein
LKPYTYVDQTLMGIQSSKNQKSLHSIDSNHMEEKFDENSKDHSKAKIIGTYHTIMSKEALVNMMSKQVMKKYLDHEYKVL